MFNFKFTKWLVLAGLMCLMTHSVEAQELVPRSFWPAPKGTNVLVLGYQYSTGDVVTDPTLPIAVVDSKITTAILSYQRTTNLFGRTSNLQFILPYVDGSTTGVVEGEFRRRNLSATGDARIQLSVNLKGAPSMNQEQFQAMRANPPIIVGVNFALQLPTGKYEKDKVINSGSNRLAAKLGVGVIWPIRPGWLIEGDLSAWWFGDNDEFLGTTRQQDPISSFSLHLIKQFRPGFWASLGANYYYGGKSVVGGEPRGDLQRNSRFGGTIVYPFKRHHALRLAYSTGVVTESGGDYNSINLSYIYGW